MFFDGNFERSNVTIKDFFHELFHELVSDESGMFTFNDSKTLAWFPSNVRFQIHIQENTFSTLTVRRTFISSIFKLWHQWIHGFNCHFHQHQATHDHHRYFLFGVLCGLALYNQCLIHLPFSMALFKKLLGVKPSLEDIMEFSPDVGK